MSGSTAPWRILSYNPSLGNPRAGHGNASLQKEEKLRKQVQFKVDELGNELDLPSDLILFLGDGAVKECSLSTCPAAHPTKSSQHSHALTGWPQPKVPAAVSPSQSHSQYQARPERERPDPVKYPCWWIADKMSQPSNCHPHWWREIKASGRTNLGACVVHKGHNDPAAQHYALWQVAAFRLPVVQQEEWWDVPPMLHGLHLQDFLPPASDP